MYSGAIKKENPENHFEDLCYIFNASLPQDYRGRSMSVSDVIEMRHESKADFFYCDSLGFIKIEEFS